MIFLIFYISLNSKWKPCLLSGYLAQPGLKMAVNMGCANDLAEDGERLFGTTVVQED